MAAVTRCTSSGGASKGGNASTRTRIAAAAKPISAAEATTSMPVPNTMPAIAVQARRKWWPDWGSPLIWRLGFMLGTINAIYFATNAFIPAYLTAHGQGEWISAALTALNVGQLPASILLLMFASRFELKVWPYVACGLLCAAAIAGIAFGTGMLVVASAALIGFAAAAILVLVLALPPLLAPPDDVHRVTAAMFTISYTWAVGVPVISGLMWDLTGIAATAFLPIAICGFLLVVLAPAINHVRRA